jgi:hypothetical protein
MYLIERLWVDPLENRNAYGFKVIGCVSATEEADRICSLEFVKKSDFPWPLWRANEFKGNEVPRFRANEIKELDGYGLEQLKSEN